MKDSIKTLHAAAPVFNIYSEEHCNTTNEHTEYTWMCGGSSGHTSSQKLLTMHHHIYNFYIYSSTFTVTTSRVYSIYSITLHHIMYLKCCPRSTNIHQKDFDQRHDAASQWQDKVTQQLHGSVCLMLAHAACSRRDVTCITVPSGLKLSHMDQTEDTEEVILEGVSEAVKWYFLLWKALGRGKVMNAHTNQNKNKSVETWLKRDINV